MLTRTQGRLGYAMLLSHIFFLVRIPKTVDTGSICLTLTYLRGTGSAQHSDRKIAYVSSPSTFDGRLYAHTVD